MKHQIYQLSQIDPRVRPGEGGVERGVQSIKRSLNLFHKDTKA